MVFSDIISYAQRRLAAHKAYRRAVAEIDSMSQNDLIDIGAFQTDLYRAAREQFLGK